MAEYVIKSYGLGIWGVTSLNGGDPRKAVEDMGDTVQEAIQISDNCVFVMTWTGHVPTEKELAMAECDKEFFTFWVTTSGAGSGQFKFRLLQLFQEYSKIYEKQLRNG